MRSCSGTVPYCLQDGQLKVCLVKSSDGKRWVFPKGGVEPGMGYVSNAIKETWEEAGLIGKCSKHIGKIVTTTNTTEYFRLYVVAEADVYPEHKKRERRWVEINNAREWLDPSLHVLLDSLIDALT